MKTIRTIDELRKELDGAPRPIGLVPTMGYFHDGHLALMRRARHENARVVVSLFLNPTQFRPDEDLESYPRDEERDERLAAAEGVDVLFAPSVDEMYPAGFETTVAVGALASVMEGAVRGAEHFHGVTTVVTKLLNIVAPDSAPAPVVHSAMPFPDANRNPATAPVHTFHLGLWFNSPADAARAGCGNGVTPFNGEQHAGIQVLNTANFPDAAGPLSKVHR